MKSYEELKKMKVADMTGEEYEFFMKKQKNSKPGIFKTVFHAARGKAYDILEDINEIAERDRIRAERERMQEEKLEAMINTLKKQPLTS